MFIVHSAFFSDIYQGFQQFGHLEPKSSIANKNSYLRPEPNAIKLFTSEIY
jgi:hypothetical protein